MHYAVGVAVSWNCVGVVHLHTSLRIVVADVDIKPAMLFVYGFPKPATRVTTTRTVIQLSVRARFDVHNILSDLLHVHRPQCRITVITHSCVHHAHGRHLARNRRKRYWLLAERRTSTVQNLTRRSERKYKHDGPDLTKRRCLAEILQHFYS